MANKELSSTNNRIPTYIFALGGLGEIGKNMDVIEHEDEIWIVDCGLRFPDKNYGLKGVSYFVCSFDYLVKNVQKIKGLIITHAHDDHIGGIAYLLKTIPIPKIYAARLTLEIINRKLSEFDDLKAHEMAEINDDTVLTSKHFKIDFFRVCHSTPDAFGVCMQTVNGIICISGDFRFDFLTPGEQTDINKISQIAARKVDLLLCESTNAQTPGFGSSEKYVFEELDKTISQCKGRIFIAVFASNLYRIMQIVMAAVNNGRKVFVCGRSMNNNIEAATKAGYLKVPKGAIIDDLRDIGSYNPRDILVLITGGQGEENAALNKMATGSHQTLRFEPEDTVIFSSSPIPGNYESLQDLLNKLYHANVKLYISDSDKKIHSSGHATQTELQLFIRLFNPRYVWPVHGEFKMLKELNHIGNELGYAPEQIILPRHGDQVAKVELLNHMVHVTDQMVQANDVPVDGKKIITDISLFNDRQVLANNGIINVSLLIDQKAGKVASVPNLAIRGTFYAQSNKDLINEIKMNIKNNLDSFISKKGVANVHPEDVDKVISDTTLFFIHRRYKNKNPWIICTVFYASR